MKGSSFIVALALVGGAAHAEEDAAAAEASAYADVAQAEEQVAQARERLAEAAKDLAVAIRAEHVVGRSDRAFLGVLLAEQGEDGIRVAGVSPGSGAEDAGLEADDVLVAINGESLVGDDEPIDILHEVLEGVDAGDPVEVVVLRDDETMPVEVVTTKHVFAHRLDDFDIDFSGRDFDSDFEWHMRTPPRMGFSMRRAGRGFRDHDGLRLADIGEDLGDYFGVDAGVLVLDTPAGSEFKPGDILKRIDGAAVSSSADAYRLLRRLEEDAEAEVRRKNREVMVGVSPRSVRERHRVVVIDGHDEDHEEEER